MSVSTHLHPCYYREWNVQPLAQSLSCNPHLPPAQVPAPPMSISFPYTSAFSSVLDFALCKWYTKSSPMWENKPSLNPACLSCATYLSLTFTIMFLENGVCLPVTASLTVIWFLSPPRYKNWCWDQTTVLLFPNYYSQWIIMHLILLICSMTFDTMDNLFKLFFLLSVLLPKYILLEGHLLFLPLLKYLSTLKGSIVRPAC